MQITLNITEDSKVELVKDSCELVQGECCFTDFVFNFPETIKGHAISEYTKYIEFAECKELGECVKFVDEIHGEAYALSEACTAFKKIMVQIVLERIIGGEKITWKTVPFTLEFVESVNANGAAAIQAQLLCLDEIRAEWQKDLEETKDEWAAFMKSACLRLVYSAADVPFANEESEGDTIFYLGENAGDFTYGHYYHCVNIDGTCQWQDLTQDPSIEGVANGIREINKHRTMQLWVGTGEELLENPPQGETLIIPDDVDAPTELAEIINENNISVNTAIVGAVKNAGALIPYYDENAILHIGDRTIPYKKLLWEGSQEIDACINIDCIFAPAVIFVEGDLSNKIIEVVVEVYDTDTGITSLRWIKGKVAVSTTTKEYAYSYLSWTAYAPFAVGIGGIMWGKTDVSTIEIACNSATAEKTSLMVTPCTEGNPAKFTYTVKKVYEIVENPIAANDSIDKGEGDGSEIV